MYHGRLDSLIQPTKRIFESICYDVLKLGRCEEHMYSHFLSGRVHIVDNQPMQVFSKFMRQKAKSSCRKLGN